jgi:hypothetical protein
MQMDGSCNNNEWCEILKQKIYRKIIREVTPTSLKILPLVRRMEYSLKEPLPPKKF